MDKHKPNNASSGLVTSLSQVSLLMQNTGNNYYRYPHPLIS